MKANVNSQRVQPKVTVPSFSKLGANRKEEGLKSATHHD